MKAIVAVATLGACTPLDECEPQIVRLRDVAAPLVLGDLALEDATIQVEAENLVEQTTTSIAWALQAVEGGWGFTDTSCGLGVCFVSADIPPRCPGSRYLITFTLADLAPVVLEGDASINEELCFWGEENCFRVQVLPTAIQ